MRKVFAAVLIFSAILSPREGVSGPGEQQQFDFWGFSISEPQAIGQELELVGVLVPGTTRVPLLLNFALNEYTVYVRDLVLAQRFQSGPAIESHYSGGYAEIYQDPSFNAPFAYNSDSEDIPPLDPAEVPANFMDGVMLVRMSFRDFITLFYPASGIGTIAYTASELKISGGTVYSYLKLKGMLTSWHMGGGFSDDPRFIPPGYGMRYDPLFRWEGPTAVEPATWGAIKATYR